MNNLIFLFLKRIRLPLLLLITSYAVVILGFVLIPGRDDQGNVWHMSFFHAFYFVSFMGSTIGFGEIPYEFTNAQRMWTVFSIYITVTVWLYSIGAVLSTLQNPTFKKILRENEFRRKIRRIKEPFYLICGYGDTGKLLAHELAENHILSVVIDIDPERIDDLLINEPYVDIPALAGNASYPEVLEKAGLTKPDCRGVIALTNKDHVNLKIAIAARLLSKKRVIDDSDLMLVCRAESSDAEANMASFGTSHIINPYEVFARRLALSIRSPSAYLVYEWLTSVHYLDEDDDNEDDISEDEDNQNKNDKTHLVREEPICPPKGLWVICGYGRFGKAVARHLNYVGIQTRVIEAMPELTHPPEGSIHGKGTEAITLREANITEAVAIVAGTDNDANNLSIIITAKDELKRVWQTKQQNRAFNSRYHLLVDDELQQEELAQEQHKLFTVARQNHSHNRDVFKQAELDFIMQPASIIAGEILSIIKTPMLDRFLSLARRQKDAWANLLISRISSFIEEDVPNTWMLEISEQQTPAVAYFLKQGTIMLDEMLRHPRNRDKSLNCVVLLVHRKISRLPNQKPRQSAPSKRERFKDYLLPEGDFEIQKGDQLLFCGDSESMNLMCWTVSNINVYNYLRTGYELPGGYVWQWIYKHKLLRQEKLYSQQESSRTKASIE